MPKERLQQTQLDLPSEVIQIIGAENLFLESAMKHNVMLATLEKIYKTKGLDYIKKYRDQLIENSKVLDMF